MVFKVGDLVWAKMKGYPPWPAKIAEPSTDAKAPKHKKSHFVYFFGSENFAWILDENISLHNETVLSTLSKKKSSAYQNAINALINFSRNKKKERQDLPRERHKEQSLPREQKFENEAKKTRMKIVKVINSSAKKHEKKLLTKQNKKFVKKRMHNSSVNGGTIECTFPKNRKLGIRSHPCVGTISPNDNLVIPDAPYAHRNAGEDVHVRVEKSSSLLQRKHVLASTKKIGFIGLGLIGKAVVLNLLKSGHHVTVWNKTAFKCDSLIDYGAKVAHSPAELIFSCDITFCSVSDPVASKSLIFGERGILKGLEQAEKLGMRNKGYVEMTSIDPETSQEINEAVSRKQGKYLEAPICGTSKNADEGTLLILASGDRRLFLDCETCFHAMGKHAYYISCEVGYGTKMSLVLSTLSGTISAAVAEAVILSARLNLNKNYFLEVLKNGPLHSDNIAEKSEMMMENTFIDKVITPLKHMQKDLNLSLLMADKFSQPMPVTAAANEVYKHARFLKYSDCDVSAVYQGVRL